MDTPNPSVSAPTREAVRKRAGEKFFTRGEEVLAKGLVKEFAIAADGSKASARVAGHGGEAYRVEVGLAPNGGFAHFCTCPVGVRGAFCKHTVAVALSWCGRGGESRESLGDVEQSAREAGPQAPVLVPPMEQSAADAPGQPAPPVSDAILPNSSLSPDAPLMPARRLSNYLYCPRLFYLQWVENLFEENEDTIAGDAVHRKADAPTRFDEEKMTALREGLPDGAVIRSLRLENEALGLCGVVDIVEGGPDGIELVDYKRGSPHRFGDGTPAAKENDMFQLAAYAMMMLADGAKLAPQATVYYVSRPVKLLTLKRTFSRGAHSRLTAQFKVMDVHIHKCSLFWQTPAAQGHKDYEWEPSAPTERPCDPMRTFPKIRPSFG